MDSQPNDFPDGLLGRATDLLRRRPMPAGPSAEAMADLGEMMARLNRPRFRYFARSLLAAAIALIFSGVAYWAIDLRQNIAFGDVVQAVREFRSLQYTQKFTVIGPDQTRQTMTGQGLIDDAGRMRFTNAGIVWILDPIRGTSLMLVERQKLAFAGKVGDLNFAQPNILARMRNLRPEGGKPIEPRDIGGRKVPGFEAQISGGTIRFWIDPSTHLPILVDFTLRPAGMLPGREIIFTDLVWNAGVDESQFSTTPPVGYRVLPATTMNFASQPTEQSLIDGLKAVAQLNFGQFPSGLDMDALKEMMKNDGEKIARNPQLREKMESIGPAAMLQIGKMWSFISDPKNGSDWHYAGAGVALGQHGRAVFWYLPSGQWDYRVIDADGQVRNVEAADLPQVPSRPAALSAGGVPSTQP